MITHPNNLRNHSFKLLFPLGMTIIALYVATHDFYVPLHRFYPL